MYQKLSDDWTYPIDNDFATRLLADAETTITPSGDSASSRLCGKCEKLELGNSTLLIYDTWSELETRLAICDFCKMRWDVSKHLDREKFTHVSFDKVKSTLRMNEGNIPVFSLCRSPGEWNYLLLLLIHTTRANVAAHAELKTAAPLQIGFPRLPGSGSRLHFQILRQWLNNCNKNHMGLRCRPSSTFLPTRLIDVGRQPSTSIRLFETAKTDRCDYIALSHPWGSEPHFCTFRTNIEQHKMGIDVADLPATFKDAVTVTQELGLRYLWIDSLCIIQGKDGDFEQEAERMEDVFSSAYCVIAASSAQAQTDGFLGSREDREYLTIRQRGQCPVYICRLIDDFNKHVLEGPLNKRGWVMQERVLAHRTIYFTNKQTYWQCGDGVRCETLTKMDK